MRPFTVGRPAFLGAALLICLGCGAPPGALAPPRDPVDLSPDWVLTAPGSVGVDDDALRAALEGAASVSGLESVAVVRRGRVVGERYLQSATAEAPHPIRSITKT